MCLRAVLKSFVRPAGETAGVFVPFEEEIPCGTGMRRIFSAADSSEL